MSARKITFILFTLILFSNIYSQQNGFGIGVMLGEPTGISGKYWLDKETAVSGGLAYSLFSSNRGFSLHADLIYHLTDILKTEEEIPFYYGFGFRLRAKERTEGSFGVRGVAGFVWQRRDYPVDIFIEAVPVFKLLPETNIDFDFALGGRYYFKK